jgi:hypothetical protein
MLGSMASQTEQHAVPSHLDGSATRLQLAKKGDREALQSFACQSLTTDVSQMENLMRADLDQIGGDFTIQIYRQLLDSDQKFLPQIERLRKDPAEDALPRLPSILVLFRLPKLLPAAGIPTSPLLDYEVDPNQDFGLRAKWRAWIDAHKSEIQNLQPTAKGINVDLGYCSKSNDDASRHQ